MSFLRRRATAGLLALGLAAVAAPGAYASTLPAAGTAVKGVDISWPNCPKGMGIPQRRTLGNPMPPVGSRFVVLGLTNGPAFTPNPCLASQVAWVRARHLWTGVYSITSYPTAAQLSRYGGTGALTTRLWRVGVAEARVNLTTMRHAGLAKAPMAWVDVEPVKGWPWSASTANNNAVIDGVLAGYKAAGMRVGLYSYRYGWNEITGGRRLPSIPTWVPLSTCSKASFSGGPIWMTQTTSNGTDFDTTCPGISGTPATRSPLTPYATTRLALGSRGAAVVALQRRLGATADGVFGSRTRAKVVAFQQAHRLSANGVVDPQVWKALGAGSTVPGNKGLFPLLFAST